MKPLIHFIKICFLFIYQAIFFLFDKFIPSSKQSTVFYITDKTFGDNLFYFYQFLEGKKKLKNRIIIQDKKLFIITKNDNKNTFYAYSLMGLWLYFRSQIVIIQNGDSKLFFFPLLLNPETKFILNLWHGIPLKKLNRQVKHYQKNRVSFQYQKYSALIVSSEFERLLMASCFYMDIDNIWITGSPRNDELTKKEISNPNLKKFDQKKVILYAPTWREYGNKTSFFPFEDYNESKLIDFLEQHDIYLLLRGHRLEMNLLQEEYSSLINQSQRIVLADQKQFPNIPELLQISTAIITDYSSIYLDFLILKRPIIFTPYDLEQYQSYRGFLFDYKTHTPGPKVFSQKEFLTELNNITSSKNHFQDNILDQKELMHKFSDNRSKKRIFDKISTKLDWKV
jgi:CDP-glycerol glycerophosphotransferase (TagB/SpsB family)